MAAPFLERAAPVDFHDPGLARQRGEARWHARVARTRGVAKSERKGAALAGSSERDTAAGDGKARFAYLAPDIVLARPAEIEFEVELGAAHALRSVLDPSQTPQGEQAQQGRSAPQAKLSAAEAEANHGGEPRRSSRLP